MKRAWIQQTAGTHGQGLSGLETAEFFRQEYKVNHAIATLGKPQVSLWDGVVMGGGVGISIHGKYRVSTENTLFSMPETAIGLFPDVGSMYWMPRMLPMSMARYIALTGARLKAPDLLYAGLATHYIPSERFGDLKNALIQATQTLTLSDVVAPVLMSFHETPPTDPKESFLAKNRESIDAAFQTASNVEDIMQGLQELDNSFGRDTYATMESMSPTSMKVTFEGLKRGAELDTIGDVLQMEYRMSQGFMREGSDFYRGIRAVLVDKDGNPQWSPGTLEEVEDVMVEEYFAPLGEHEWQIPSNYKIKSVKKR